MARGVAATDDGLEPVKRTHSTPAPDVDQVQRIHRHLTLREAEGQRRAIRGLVLVDLVVNSLLNAKYTCLKVFYKAK